MIHDMGGWHWGNGTSHWLLGLLVWLLAIVMLAFFIQGLNGNVIKSRMDVVCNHDDCNCVWFRDECGEYE